MSCLKNKSEINKLAADLLHKQSLYPTVIHSAYYSCLQLVKHIIIKDSTKTEEEVEEQIRNSGESSHEYMINLLTTSLKSKGKDFRLFNSNINQLKRLRVESDYRNISVDFNKSKNSIDLNEIVIKHLKANCAI